MSVAKTAQERVQAAQSAMTEAATRNQSAMGVLYKHFLKARLEMIDGVREVLTREIERVETRANQSPDPAKSGS